MNPQNFFSKNLGITDKKVIQAFENIITVREFSKNERIFSEGEIPSNFYFNIKGIFRGYMFNQDGSEITDCFGFRAGAPITSVNRIGEPAKTNMEAVTNLTAIQMPMTDLITLIENNPELLAIYNNLLQEALDRHWKIKEARYRLSATDRYKWFLETYPDLIEYVRMKDIASFLGMSPVSLSRIRKTLKEMNEQ